MASADAGPKQLDTPAPTTRTTRCWTVQRQALHAQVCMRQAASSPSEAWERALCWVAGVRWSSQPDAAEDSEPTATVLSDSAASFAWRPARMAADLPARWLVSSLQAAARDGSTGTSAVPAAQAALQLAVLSAWATHGSVSHAASSAHMAWEWRASAALELLQLQSTLPELCPALVSMPTLETADPVTSTPMLAAAATLQKDAAAAAALACHAARAIPSIAAELRVLGQAACTGGASWAARPSTAAQLWPCSPSSPLAASVAQVGWTAKHWAAARPHAADAAAAFMLACIWTAASLAVDQAEAWELCCCRVLSSCTPRVAPAVLAGAAVGYHASGFAGALAVGDTFWQAVRAVALQPCSAAPARPCTSSAHQVAAAALASWHAMSADADICYASISACMVLQAGLGCWKQGVLPTLPVLAGPTLGQQAGCDARQLGKSVRALAHVGLLSRTAGLVWTLNELCRHELWPAATGEAEPHRACGALAALTLVLSEAAVRCTSAAETAAWWQCVLPLCDVAGVLLRVYCEAVSGKVDGPPVQVQVPPHLSGLTPAVVSAWAVCASQLYAAAGASPGLLAWTHSTVRHARSMSHAAPQGKDVTWECTVQKSSQFIQQAIAKSRWAAWAAMDWAAAAGLRGLAEHLQQLWIEPVSAAAFKPAAGRRKVQAASRGHKR